MFRNLAEATAHYVKELGSNVDLIKNVSMGLEREGLRITPEGKLSQIPHPKLLGSSFTNPNITTDFSENLLEFVTNVYHSPETLYQALDEIHAYTEQCIGDELIWPDSMPPEIDSEDDIPVAQFGTTNAAKMKTLYRTGLSNRYGKMMQVIAGIHFNFSLSDDFFRAFQKVCNDTQSLEAFKSDRYLHLMRSVSRFGFIVPYLFGASPIMPKTFLHREDSRFEEFDEHSVYLKEGTSLRLSDIGYGNNKCEFSVSFNSLEDYIRDIEYAINTPCEKVAHIPIKKNGEYMQISNHILQIENEYYASIRPKQILKENETLLTALKNRGIEYVELRTIDIMPTISTGISIDTIRFLQAFLTTCLLSDAIPLTKEEYDINQKNLRHIAEKGRANDVRVKINNHDYTLNDAVRFVIEWMRPICTILGSEYVRVLDEQTKINNNPSETPAAKIIDSLKSQSLTYQQYCLEKAKTFKRQYLTEKKLSETTFKQFQQQAKESLKKLEELENIPQEPFDTYLKRYFEKIG